MNPEMAFDEINASVKNSIEEFFTYELQRPEILNRIGENIIVFDFIRETVAKEIFDKMLANIFAAIEENFDIQISICDEVRSKVEKICTCDLAMGGRGIGNKLEDSFINPISRALFEMSPQKNDIFEITDIQRDELSWILSIEKKSTSA